MTLNRAFPEPPPAALPEFTGRWVLAMALAVLAYGICSPYMAESLSGPRPQSWALPRLVIFLLAALVASIVQGARPPSRRLWILAVPSLTMALALLPYVDPGWASWAVQAGPFQSSIQSTSTLWSPVIELAWVISALTASVALGTLIARTLDKPAHLLAVVLCAAAGEAWFSVSNAGQLVTPGHPVRILQLPFPPHLANAISSPSFLDLMFLSLYLEATRRFRFSTPSVLFGAVGGYMAASLLAVTSWRITLALPMTGLGVLMGAWPDFRCSVREVVKAFGAALLLFALLLGLSSLYKKLQPPPQNSPDYYRLRDVAEKDEGFWWG